MNPFFAQRLINQQIASTDFKKPEEIVRWLGAVQAQEYAMAKWAIGLRVSGFSDEDIEKVFNEGKIIRTHLLRPTWHFVAPEDLRWMLKLTGPRISAANAFMYRKEGVDDEIVKRSHAIIIKSLQGGKHLTRNAINAEFEKKKIMVSGHKLSYLMMQAELDGIICSGPREGKQFTYALTDERVPADKHPFKKDEALAELSKRYFASRGPATLQDYTTWSGLTVKDARTGVASLGSEFIKETIGNKEYIFIPTGKTILPKHQTAFLMADYDEYGMGYKDRSAIFAPKHSVNLNRGTSPVFNRMIVIDGQIAGIWNRSIQSKTVTVDLVPFYPLSKARQKEVLSSAQKFASFVKKELVANFMSP